MKKRTSIHIFLTLPLLLAPAAFAQHQTFSVDSATSIVSFSLGDPLHSVHGTFHVASGSVDLDSAASKIAGSIVVSAASGVSGDNTRDDKMHKEVLDVPHFADISFAPFRYQGTIAPSGDSTIQITGTFTLHGTPHELTVPMQIHIEGANYTAKTHFPVPYVKWGLKDPSVFVLRVAKVVEIDLTLVGRVASGS